MRVFFTGLLYLLLAPSLVYGQQDKTWSKVRAKYDKGKYYAGVGLCDRKLSGKSPDSRYLVLRAEGNNHIAEYERAMRDATEALGKVEGELVNGAALQLGIALLNMGFTDSALHWLNASLGTTDDSNAYYRSGLLDRIAGRCEEAVAAFDRVLERYPERSSALRERGGCHAILGDTVAARRDLDKAISLAPKDPVAWNSRGYDLFSRNEQWGRAILDFDKAIRLDPNYSYAFNNRGWAYYKLGDKDRAYRDIALAGRKKRSNPYVFRNLGVMAMDAGDMENACGHFRTALDLRFTELHGSEVEDLMRSHCGAKAPVVPEPGETPTQRTPERSNAPERGNAP